MKLDDMVEVVTLAPAVYLQAFSGNKIRDGFVTTGEISKSKVHDSKYISCPDLEAMMKQCKVTNLTIEEEARFLNLIVPSVKEVIAKGKISEEFFDHHGLSSVDTTVDGEEVPRKFTDNQMHLHRGVVLNHQAIRERNSKVMDQKIKASRSNSYINTMLPLLAFQPTKPARQPSVNQQAKLRPQDPLSRATVALKHLMKPTKPQLEAFIRVRVSKDIFAPIDMPKSKGTVAKVEQGETELLLKKAYDLLELPVIATPPPPCPVIQFVPMVVPKPNVTRLGEKNSLEVTADLVRRTCTLIASLEDKGETHTEFQTTNLNNLQSKCLSNTLLCRLRPNLIERNVNPDHPVWGFVEDNMELGALVMKLHGHTLDDSGLKTRYKNQPLFTATCLRNLEYLSGPEGDHAEDKKNQCGAYLVDNINNLGLIRAGSASVGFGPRWKDHEREAKKVTTSVFYSDYPDRGNVAMEDGRVGTFDELRQVTAVRYKRELKEGVTGLFHWSEKTLRCLEKVNPVGCTTLLEKKHRMVCYFFEKIYDLALGTDSGVSSNPGFECFVGIWNGGHGAK